MSNAVFKKIEEKITDSTILTFPAAGMACFTFSSSVIGTYYLMHFPIYIPNPSICFYHAIMGHFSPGPYIYFPEFHYQILDVCMAHTGGDVFPGNYKQLNTSGLPQ